uniref:Vacuolar protein sorting-associated protein 28 homolog n=1 Tax=Mantoniella antarctica TaxID=81844 RepID=A0A7S0SGF9_9CHLO|mmetsp:Transcript_25959/g.41678  ORF Transcript_25959/g.41678 Transcript_25959/m.41678 type:complete len:234 (-) Transcript_25959:977-1678(-)|eukprot:CAMPEP_0181366238 /NCGR_PEP_ID=MMETSP1106-20121128/10571_1 /TAXON_ID=81844 /ORGANISM="Mantoniella antarctica, Strain SL-175" /LENGTH=233 /DNA_ID=CAMNT_0023481521 /DNA_START=452 /DNA_END=1153 /DNA_ORIENTATION=+
MAPAQEAQEVKLWSNKKERQQYDNFANLFALIKTVEKLEKAYVNSAVPSAGYEAACAELITKYKTARTTLADTVPDVQHFMATYSMHCLSARHRLQVGFPATIEHRVNVNRPGDPSSAVAVAECVHHYIGAMDTLKLNMAAKDQIAPCLSDLVISLHKVPQLPADFPGKACVRRWIGRLDNMRASDELGEDEVRQLLYEIENSYNAFMQLLGGQGGGRGQGDGGGSSTGHPNP